MWKNIIIGAIVLILVGIGGYSLWKNYSGTVKVSEEPAMEEPVVWSTYASSTLGFSIMYPPGYTVDDSYAYDQFGEKKLIHGVKFHIPESMATGTNLSSFDTGVSVEQLPRAKNCTGDIYLLANVAAYKVTEGGIEYSLATSSGAAAGNRYDEMVYALSTSSPCTAVRYFIHSTNIENYELGAVREFDLRALIFDFDKIRQSLTIER